jgi:phosphotransferase system  glucose/maltose/N-acetylglucosamine-specific IIC component
MGKRVIPGSLGPIRWFTRAIPGAVLVVVGLLWVVGSLGVLFTSALWEYRSGASMLWHSDAGGAVGSAIVGILPLLLGWGLLRSSRAFVPDPVAEGSTSPGAER